MDWLCSYDHYCYQAWWLFVSIDDGAAVAAHLIRCCWQFYFSHDITLIMVDLFWSSNYLKLSIFELFHLTNYYHQLFSCLVANSVILFLPFDFGAIICDTIGNFQINRIIQFVILSSVFMPTDVSTIMWLTIGFFLIFKRNFIINTPGLAMANQYVINYNSWKSLNNSYHIKKRRKNNKNKIIIKKK